MCSSLVSAPAAGLSQKPGMPSGPLRPTTRKSPFWKRISSRSPIAANVCR